ncbi:putative ribonuclease H-like domain-containing protein [Tanacetum coccineum]
MKHQKFSSISSNLFKEDSCSKGIEHQTSVARTPKHNGIVKRQNRTLVEAARTMLSTAKVPFPMFNEYFNGATSVVSKSSAVTTADASDKHQQPNTTSSSSTTVAEEITYLDIQTTPEPTT